MKKLFTKKIFIIAVSILLVIVLIFGAVAIYKKVTTLKSNIISSDQPIAITLPRPSDALSGIYWGLNFARNPWDMQAFDGKVFISSGDYGENSGPAKIIAYNPKDGSFSNIDSLYSEQITRFYVSGDTLYTFAIDPISWGNGEFYAKKKGSGDSRFEYFDVFPSFVHCLDMIEYDDKLFFCGQVMDRTYSLVQYINLSDMPVVDESTTHHPRMYKDGVLVTGEHILISMCELFEFEGNLYAHHISSERIGDPYAGLYVYNKELDRFDYVEGEKTLKPVLDKHDGNVDYDLIQAEVTYDNKLVFANNGLFYTSDLKNYTECSFGEDYKGFIAHDLLEIDGQLYVLASKQLKNGKHKTCVFVTEDLEEFAEVLNFESNSYMISFEYIDKTFIFGEGGTAKDTAESCGNLYAVKVK